MSTQANALDSTVLSLVASLAPDRMSAVTADSDLVDDLGFDSPRKLELVAALETHLGQRIPDPVEPVQTVGDVIDWISGHFPRSG